MPNENMTPKKPLTPEQKEKLRKKTLANRPAPSHNAISCGNKSCDGRTGHSGKNANKDTSL